MEELYQKYQKGQLQMMPAWWQHEAGVHLLGQYNSIAFYFVSELEIENEKIENEIRYATTKELTFDKKMHQASKRILQRKRSQR